MNLSSASVNAPITAFTLYNILVSPLVSLISYFILFFTYKIQIINASVYADIFRVLIYVLQPGILFIYFPSLSLALKVR